LTAPQIHQNTAAQSRVHGLASFASGSTLQSPQARFAGASCKAILLLPPGLTGKIGELNSRFPFFTARRSGQAAVGSVQGCSLEKFRITGCSET